MSALSFTPDFIKQFKITGYHQGPKQGGQKVVYFPIIEGENSVLKIIRGGKDHRFDREMEIYDKFSHLDGLPRVRSTTEYNNEIIVIEEFIEGDTLCDILPNYQNNSQLITQLMKDIFEVMIPIWEAQLVHRDIKPQNIIIKPDGKPVVIDFGIARDLSAGSITHTGFQPMSWMFASPEQYAGDKDRISYKTDFFSLGALSYYLFHKKLPFGKSEAEINIRFKGTDESFKTDVGFTLTPFCNEAMKFSASERPRFISDLFSLL